MQEKNEVDFSDLTIQDLVAILWRHRVMIFIITLATALGAGIYSVAFTTTETVYRNYAYIDQDIYNVNLYYLESMVREEMTKEVAEGYRDNSMLAASFNLEVIDNAQLIKVSARSEDKAELDAFIYEMSMIILDTARETRLNSLDFKMAQLEMVLEQIDRHISDSLEIAGDNQDWSLEEHRESNLYLALSDDKDVLFDDLFAIRAENISDLIETEVFREQIITRDIEKLSPDMIIMGQAVATTHYAVGRFPVNIVIAGVLGFLLACLFALIKARRTFYKPPLEKK